jgi:hypothetical protein
MSPRQWRFPGVNEIFVHSTDPPWGLTITPLERTLSLGGGEPGTPVVKGL